MTLEQKRDLVKRKIAAEDGVNHDFTLYEEAYCAFMVKYYNYIKNMCTACDLVKEKSRRYHND